MSAGSGLCSPPSSLACPWGVPFASTFSHQPPGPCLSSPVSGFPCRKSLGQKMTPVNSLVPGGVFGPESHPYFVKLVHSRASPSWLSFPGDSYPQKILKCFPRVSVPSKCPLDLESGHPDVHPVSNWSRDLSAQHWLGSKASVLALRVWP